MKSQPKTGRRNHRGRFDSGKRSLSARRKRIRLLTPRQFMDILEPANDGLVMLDRGWHYVDVNQQAEEMLQRRKPFDLIRKQYLFSPVLC